MKTWEHTTVNMVGPGDIVGLDELGTEGWKLISVVSQQSTFTAYLRRQIKKGNKAEVET